MTSTKRTETQSGLRPFLLHSSMDEGDSSLISIGAIQRWVTAPKMWKCAYLDLI